MSGRKGTLDLPDLGLPDFELADFELPDMSQEAGDPQDNAEYAGESLCSCLPQVCSFWCLTLHVCVSAGVQNVTLSGQMVFQKMHQLVTVVSPYCN